MNGCHDLSMAFASGFRIREKGMALQTRAHHVQARRTLKKQTHACGVFNGCATEGNPMVSHEYREMRPQSLGQSVALIFGLQQGTVIAVAWHMVKVICIQRKGLQVSRKSRKHARMRRVRVCHDRNVLSSQQNLRVNRPL